MDEFELKATTPEFWFAQARQMYEASLVLFKELSKREATKSITHNFRKVGSHKGSLFFLGIAIENAIKGVLAHEGIIVVDDKKMKFDRSVKAHDLVSLLELIGNKQVTISSAERELLARLTIFTTWAGKYGTPLRESDMRAAKDNFFQRASDYELAHNLIEGLERISKENIFNGD